ncbi:MULTISPECIES: AraC family transcriptional regulator [unclassified Streptomyces]|uniref:AraC family transcriptional regulator n=1 Tax=unclassified Streptomyces TaxID=2593676 RepID=UPI0006923227|nr:MULTISPECIES: AraC family transcriptional regulator [unclassified Streptomyces]
MSVDPLSDVLALVRARCEITGGLRAGGRWALRSGPRAEVKLDAVTDGACWLLAPGRLPLRLAAGDVVVLNGAGPVVLCSDPEERPVEEAELPASAPGALHRLGSGGDVTIVGGHVELDPAAAEWFTSALPDVLHAAAHGVEAARMRNLLEEIVEETAQARPGAAFARHQHAQLLLLHALRVGVRGGAGLRPGWLRLLADARLRLAVAAVHADPARPWGLRELAAVAGMSRSHFARRFREVAGQTPLAYLSHWRVRLAQQALRDSDTTVAALGERLGYASESSFSHAFRRVVGMSPSRYRRNAADGS